MDPNEMLRLIRSAVAASLQMADDYEKSGDDYPATAEDAGNYIDQLDELAQLVQALDQWLTRGGFFPDAWGKDLLREAVAAQLREGQVPSLPDPEPQTASFREIARREAADPLGPPNPAHADGSLLDQLDADLAHAGEVVRRMKGER